MFKNLGGMMNKSLHGSNNHCLRSSSCMNINRQDADYEPPAWLAVDAPAMAVDGERVWAWVGWLTLTGLTFAVMFKALVWFGGMP